MVKITLLSVVIGSVLLIGLIMASDSKKGDMSCAAIGNDNSQTTGGCGQMVDKAEKSNEEWQAKLSPEQFRITRKKGTEPAFSGKYWNFKGAGTYTCVCCGEELFSSQAKYDSGSGWPSFWAPISEGSVGKQSDPSLGMVRTEVTCSNCGAHLGHVFDDGPRPTGQRYCINSAALDFVADETDEQH